jgi:hypothetical protein
MNNSFDAEEINMVCISDIDIHPFFTARDSKPFNFKMDFVLGHARRSVPLSVTVSSQISCYTSNLTEVLRKIFFLLFACSRHFIGCFVAIPFEFCLRICHW